ncbi:S8 family serine peptidase [Streptomyces sp. NPDC051920]|uniref:S8 family serine peptidase n=1 Tax=Streptomyces sp. NPDC051920 TaxID=3155523 RepID=UPI0034362B75
MLIQLPLSRVSLAPLMARSTGSAGLRVGLVDGPVMVSHQGFGGARIERLRPQDVARPDADDVAAVHATSTAGVLVADRESGAPGICSGVTLVTRSVFPRSGVRSAGNASWRELSDALVELTDAGVRVVNMSLSLPTGLSEQHRWVQDALDHAAARGVVVVAAAGNDGLVDGTVVTRHRAVVPVVSYDRHGLPGRTTNIGRSIGRRGIGVVTDGLSSLGPHGSVRPFGGTSAAAAVVTGAVALLWSELPHAAPEELISALKGHPSRRTSVVPPLMNAWRAFESLHGQRSRQPSGVRHRPREMRR